MPDCATVWRWRQSNEDFRNALAQAREGQAHAYADEMVEIADNPDVEADVQRDRLRVDTRKWIASKFAPKQFGDKADVNLTGAVSLEHWVGQALEMRALPDGTGSGEKPE